MEMLVAGWGGDAGGLRRVVTNAFPLRDCLQLHGSWQELRVTGGCVTGLRYSRCGVNQAPSSHNSATWAAVLQRVASSFSLALP